MPAATAGGIQALAWARRACESPNSQAARASVTAEVRSRARPSGPACWVNTQVSKAAAPYIGKARTFLKMSIQAPGCGRRAIRAGANARLVNGAAKPRPRARNTASDTTGGWVTA